VGVDRHSNWPESVRQLPTLGGLDDTPLERLVALKPDLVLLPPSSRLIPRLNELGIAALPLPTQSHADVQAALHAIGTRLGRPDLAAKLWADAQAQIQQAAQSIAAPMRGRRVYVEVSSEPHAAGPASFIGQTLQALGLRNIAPESAGPFPRLNPEFIVRAQPDLIVAPQAAFERIRQRPGWSGMAAAAEKACALPPAEWERLVRPGPRLGQAAQVLADCVNRSQAPQSAH
jgi:iron complex transport system substrate-binding protein